MEINELFKILVEEESENLRGELTLTKDSIIWSFDLELDDDDYDTNNDYEDDYGFDSTSTAELLEEAYNIDIEIIEILIDRVDGESDWMYSPPQTKKTNISFKIS
jgi:hypothetical protein